ncbi:hypothetical protein [Schaalia sp. Marseille-Q2122]|uniref:hypothetical protein n=1 Tax=Schaalia sp. Marseille-Q2122 TaxID=2736604 RepID=UPI001589B836|nr:hypothetical protein [Schaalia sp. Marseille-Q2122]
MSVENTQRDDETTVLPVADEEETVLLPAAGVEDVDASAEDAPAIVTDEVDAPAEDGVDVTEEGAAAAAEAAAPSGAVPDDAPPATGVNADAGAASGSGSGSGSASTIPQSPLPGAGTASVQEAPAGGVRVAQLVWAGLVIVLGVFMIAISFLRFVSIPLLLISLIAALGIALMAAAVVTSVKKG